MRHGEHPAWMLLPGDRLPEGATVEDCESIGGGLVQVAITRADGSLATVNLPREMPVEVNAPR